MVRCQLVEMPLSIRGFTREDVNGNYTIFINANLNEERREKTFQHELKHIANEDFRDYRLACEIEKDT